MQSFMYTVKTPVGLHARHAGILVKTAKSFESRITVALDDRSADATHLFGLLGLGVRQGALIRVTVEGPDEDAAALRFKAVLWENL